MFNVNKIVSKLYGVVGFRQPFNLAYQKLDADNQISRSGNYVTDNEFCKVQYLLDTQDFENITDDDFNLFLKRKQQESISSVCSAVFNNVDFIDRGLFYKYAMNKTNIENLPAGFIGYRIEIENEKDKAVNIKRVLLDFDGTGDITLMLFNTSQKAPLQTKVITITTDHQAQDLDWVIDDTNGIYKGDYYIGYLSTGLTVQPYKRDYENANVLSDFTHLCITPIQVQGHNTNVLWDLTKYQGLSQTTGLNFDITVFEDFTDLIINNEFLFARAILLDVQISCLTTILSSLRSNHNERMGNLTMSRLLAEVEGQSGENAIKIYGLRPQLFRSIGSLKKEIEKLKSGYFGEGIFTETLS